MGVSSLDSGRSHQRAALFFLRFEGAITELVESIGKPVVDQRIAPQTRSGLAGELRLNRTPTSHRRHGASLSRAVALGCSLDARSGLYSRIRGISSPGAVKATKAVLRLPRGGWRQQPFRQNITSRVSLRLTKPS